MGHLLSEREEAKQLMLDTFESLLDLSDRLFESNKEILIKSLFK